MAYQSETYLGFEIKAHSQPVVGGFTAAAKIFTCSSPAKVFEVQPPKRIFVTAAAALREIVGWSRDLVDEMVRDNANNRRR